MKNKKMKHTKEPWVVHEGDDYTSIESKSGWDVLETQTLANRNAKRIVVCVNALAGIPAKRIQLIDELRALRDQYMEADNPDRRGNIESIIFEYAMDLVGMDWKALNKKTAAE